MSTYRPSWPVGGDTGELPAVTDNGEIPADDEPEAEVEDGWCYATVHEWITEWALPTLGRPALASGQRWCTQWHAHLEAVLRLTLAWKTWERARHDPAAYTSWLLDTWDRMWLALTAADGPFASCTPQRHDPTNPLPKE